MLWVDSLNVGGGGEFMQNFVRNMCKNEHIEEMNENRR